MDTRRHVAETESGARVQPRQAADAAPDSPRPVIRGESSLAISIDWVAFTVRGQGVRQLKEAVEAWLRVPVGIQHTSKGWNGYERSAHLHAITGIELGRVQAHGIGLVAWGGESQRDKTYVSLTGAGACYVRDWQTVAQALKDWSARLTRLDIAGDDLEGRWSVDRAKRLYQRSGFSTGGRRPSHSLHGDWLTQSERGRTLEVGRREHGKMLRVYEKGRQLGSPESPWVRWELQLGKRDREIPVDALADPLPYFSGAYGCMKELTGTLGERLKIVRHVKTLCLKHLAKHCRRSYGKLIDAMLTDKLGDYAGVVNALRRPGRPSRLIVNDIPFSAEQVLT